MPIAITDSQAQALIMTETGTAADATVSANIPTWWLLAASKEVSGDGLQYLYTKRQVVDYQINLVRNNKRVDLDGDRFFNEQVVTNLKLIRDNITEEIKLIEKRGRGAAESIASTNSLEDAYADDLLRIAQQVV